MPTNLNKFEFATANRIIFGSGAIRDVGSIAKEFGRRALIVTGRNAGRAESLSKLLKASGLDAVIFSVAGEPDIETIERGTAVAKQEKCELVISFGGGSALDAGKAIAAMAANQGELLDYLEIIGRGKALPNRPLPFIAIPTTAGTGSEVTRNAVLASPEHRAKVSLRSPLMLPRVALVDPELTLDLPPGITASTGLDALTQLIEPYVCARANPMTDALCMDGIRRAAGSLRKVFENGRDLGAREDMALASLYGGMALANAGLGAVHGLAGPIGGMFPAPHGATCAALLPHVMEMNLRALRARQPASEALRRYDEVARLLMGGSGRLTNTIDELRDDARPLTPDLPTGGGEGEAALASDGLQHDPRPLPMNHKVPPLPGPLLHCVEEREKKRTAQGAIPARFRGSMREIVVRGVLTLALSTGGGEGEEAPADDGVEWVRKLVADLQIPPLRTYGITANDRAEIVERAAKASSMKANPIALTAAELAEILERAN